MLSVQSAHCTRLLAESRVLPFIGFDHHSAASNCHFRHRSTVAMEAVTAIKATIVSVHVPESNQM